MSVSTRFAPSPTGDLHLGGVRTALFCWLHARKAGGVFHLRLDDTDRERSTAAAEASILDGLRWLGLDWDGEPVRQSARAELHARAARSLEAAGHAYRCTCTVEELEARRTAALAAGRAPGYDRRCRDAGATSGPAALRFRMPLTGVTAFDDLCRGRVTFDNATLEDLVILKADGTPTYNFATVVDDALMGITHIVRGDDLLISTPKQLAIFAALGQLRDGGAAFGHQSPPTYAHLPLVLGPDRQRLSKRHGAESVLSYRDRGVLPEALLNAAARLGWSGGGGDREVLTRDDMLAAFSLTSLSRSPAQYDPEKLAWLNREHLARLPAAELARRGRPWLAASLPPGTPIDDARLEGLVDLHRRSARTLADLGRQLATFFVDAPAPDAEAARAHVAPHADALGELARAWTALPAWSPAALEGAARTVASARALKFGAFAQAVRVALTGSTISAGVFDVANALGPDRALARLERALHPPAG